MVQREPGWNLETIQTTSQSVNQFIN